MNYYHIGNTLRKIDSIDDVVPYVVSINSAEVQEIAKQLEFETDLPMLYEQATCASVNTDSLTGSFSLPDRSDLEKDDITFSFVFDGIGIIFIDDTGKVDAYLNEISRTRKWTAPSLERFLYDFLDLIIRDDQKLLRNFEATLDKMENQILNEDEKLDTVELNRIRRQLRYLLNHYYQLQDVVQEFEENENGFFSEDNLRFFQLFESRVARLDSGASYLREYTIQLRDLLEQQNEVKQNRIMTLLTIITSIFMPLTLIAGWYGMNFKYMPELNWKISYPIVIAVSIAIVIVSLIYFKKKKWL